MKPITIGVITVLATLMFGQGCSPKNQKEEKGMITEVLSSPLAKQIGREVVRGVFGMLFGKRTTTTRKKSGGLFGF